MPRPPGRPCGAAHRRSCRRSRNSGSGPSTVPAHRSSRQDSKAGHHRRYRRKEPGETRPVAVAADADRRYGHQSHQPRRRSRSASTSCSPSPTGSIRMSPPDTMRYLDDVTKSKLRELPSNDQILADAIRRSRVVLGESGLTHVNAESRQGAPASPGSRRWAEIREQFMLNFPGCCATSACWRRRRPAAACSRSSPSATASSGACR